MKMKIKPHPLSATGVCHQEHAHTRAVWERDAVTMGAITHPITWDACEDGALRPVLQNKRMGQGGEGVCLMLSIALSLMTSHRLIFSWCFCAPAAFWHESNFTEMEKCASRNQPRLSAMTDDLEGILYYPGYCCNWIKVRGRDDVIWGTEFPPASERQTAAWARRV